MLSKLNLKPNPSKLDLKAKSPKDTNHPNFNDIYDFQEFVIIILILNLIFPEFVKHNKNKIKTFKCLVNSLP